MMITKELAMTYFTDMQQKDVNGLKTLANEQVTVTSPAGDLTGLESFVGFQVGFAKMIKSLSLNQLMVDDDDAVIVYTADTYPVKDARVVEVLKFRQEKLLSTEVIYDNEPFSDYLKTVDQHF